MQLEQKTITSLEVAEMVGKDHAKLLRDIRNYISQLNQSKIGFVDFFAESTYKDGKGETRPCYLVTKKGCEFIAHKLTGVKGAEFTAKYINRFHDLEEHVNKPMTALEQIALIAQGTLELETKLETVEQKVNTLENDMPLLAVDCDRITTAVQHIGVQALGGKDSNAYKDKKLRGKVYSDIHRELKRQLGVSTYKAIRRKQCDTAVALVKKYELPVVLAEQISDSNAQINMA